MPDNRPVNRLHSFLAAIAGDESAPELMPRDQLEYYLSKVAERVGNIQPGGPGWQDGVAYTPAQYQPLIENKYWNASGNAVNYTGWSITNFLPCAGAGRLEQVKTSKSLYDGRYSFFFDADKNIIPNSELEDLRVSITNTKAVYRVPDGAAYFSLSAPNSTINNIVNGDPVFVPYTEAPQ
jgi:hypothetical protein